MLLLAEALQKRVVLQSFAKRRCSVEHGAPKDKKKTRRSVEALMGKKPELRFKFITENSKKVSAENIL